MQTILFERLRQSARLPTHAHPGDAGWDVYLPDDVTLAPGDLRRVGLGFATALPPGTYARLLGRSSNAYFVEEGVVDSGYRGEWQLMLKNPDSAGPVSFNAGERIAQFILQRFEAADCVEVLPGGLPESSRGTGGFGSTGR